MRMERLDCLGLLLMVTLSPINLWRISFPSSTSVISIVRCSQGDLSRYTVSIVTVIRGDLSLSVAPVAPEVRVTSKQVLSLGDERVMLGINLTAEISRAGLFKLENFVLPAGFEVQSLSGPSLHHWSEITEDDTRKVVMHLNGKTLGTQSFALSLTAATPDVESEWELPRVSLEEAVRQTGELIVQPATGIRLKTISKQNISEVDPRALGSATNGAVAYRLLQDDWRLSLGIEKLDSEDFRRCSSGNGSSRGSNPNYSQWFV